MYSMKLFALYSFAGSFEEKNESSFSIKFEVNETFTKVHCLMLVLSSSRCGILLFSNIEGKF